MVFWFPPTPRAFAWRRLVEVWDPPPRCRECVNKGTVRWGVGCCPPLGVGRPTLVVDAFLCTSVAYADDKVWCGVGVYLLQNFLTLLGLVNTHVVQVVP